MFSSDHNIIIINFLNYRAIKLLEIIKDLSPVSTDILKVHILSDKENRIMSRSTFYRYIDLLVKNKLINKSIYRMKRGGHTYKINNIGITFLESLKKFNIEFYNKLCYDLTEIPNK